MNNWLAGTLHIYTFSGHYAVLKTKNSMKNISAINPAIAENTECSNVKACTQVNDIKVGVLL